MLKKIMVTIGMLSICLLGVSGTSHAVRLLSEEEALKQLFPTADRIVSDTLVLTPAQAAKVKAKLGGNLVHFQNGSNSEKVGETSTYKYFVGIKGSEKIGVAIIDEQPGKWGPVEFIIEISPNPGKVMNLAVMSYSEKRGRPIARNNFLDQFIGKGSGNPITLQKDIRGISGATISSDATCFAVKKALAIFEEALLPKLNSIVEKK
jgi:Na+-translocating ferredoxin:NAD+ oxidoreductase RnfG subunit